jgi:putative ABC transport system permease protein
MNWLRTLRFRLRALLDRGRMDQEIAEELRFHVEADIADRVRRGAAEAEARREALARFGGVTRLREDTRDAEGYAFVDRVVQHARYGLRSIRRAPVFAAMVTLTLGLGIGANGAMFGIIDRLLLRGPEGVEKPNELRRAYVTTRNEAGGEKTDASQSYAFYSVLRSDTALFSSAGGYSRINMRTGRGADVRTIPAMAATWDLFRVLGAKPYLGRFFDANDDRPPHGADVVVLGYDYWTRELGADPKVLGRRIEIGDQRLTVIGVAPAKFTGPERAAVDLWIPMSARQGPSPDWPTTWFASWMQFVGRVRPGVSERVMDERATAALRGGYVGNDPEMKRAVVTLRPLSYDRFGHEPPELGVARILYVVAAIVLLIAAANVANLLIARATRRQREFGVRVALGAGRGRLATMMLVESGMLATLGGVAGLAFGYWGGSLIRRTLLPEVAWDGPPVDLRVLAYTAIAVVATTLVVGMGPAIHARRGDPISALKTGLPQSGDRQGRIRTVLQLAQIALSVVLLTTAGLFVQSLWRIRNLDLGIQPDAVVQATVVDDNDGGDVRSPEDFTRALALSRTRSRQLLERVRRLRGVVDATLAIGSPFYSTFGVGIRVPGRDSLPAAPGGGPYISEVGPEYFATVGTRVLRGHAFTAADHEGSPPVVMVNQTMARTVWPNEDALTKCIIVDDNTGCAPIVGVVADARQWKLREEPAMQFYVPYGQNDHIAGWTLLVRPQGNVNRFAGELRMALARWVPNARLIEVKPLAQAIDPQVRPWRVGALMFGLFGLLALVVAAVGSFSVLSYLLAQRTKEFGVRIALGAGWAELLGLIAGGTFIRAAIGVGIGIAFTLAIAPFVQPYLFDNPARDPVVLSVVALALLGISLLAGALPSWRACRIDPVIALRLD